jgi:hypothetical protein
MEEKKTRPCLGLAEHVRRLHEIRLEKMIEEIGRLKLDDDEQPQGASRKENYT